ncbi:MAG: zinc-binding dehydrogenase [Aldersonia sp.]|nr:zinc-binding dehydrogenase [Aldersonia sp.]
MTGVVLPGNSSVRHVTLDVPIPGHGQVVLQMKASSICGSDIRAIYREHLGSGPEAYRGVVAGHEPCGQVVAVGPGCRRLAVGDRVVVYHIAGCGMCDECRHGYPIGCTSPRRAAYGWQRDGGHAEYLLAEENTCIPLPEPLSYVDGALVSCGFGTAYEGLLRLQLSGQDRLLITGLGPVGLAAAMLGRSLGAGPIIGTDIEPARRSIAVELGLVDHALPADDTAAPAVDELTGGQGCEASIDCSGSGMARVFALEHTRTWGRCAFVGEGGEVTFAVSELLIHKQITLHGSWVTSVRHMADLLELLVRRQLHPERIVTHRYSLEQADLAYRVADGGAAGKVCIVFD